jgi:hypothetical protein
MVHVWVLGLLFMNFNLTLRKVQSILLLIHIISSRETSKIKGKYNYHQIKFHLTRILGFQKERLTKFKSLLRVYNSYHSFQCIIFICSSFLDLQKYVDTVF